LSPQGPATVDLRYPIGRFEHEGPVSNGDLATWLGQLEALPEQMRAAVGWLSDAQLDTPYRPEGWTLRQVVHHVPDSHLNCYVRFKWALTEDEPVIKAYYEERWAELPDYRTVPVETSLRFLAVIHEKLVALLRSLSREQLARRFLHPDLGSVELAWNVGNYAWHGRHHLAHVTTTIERHGWRRD
jgi:DinB superfamily